MSKADKLSDYGKYYDESTFPTKLKKLIFKLSDCNEIGLIVASVMGYLMSVVMYREDTQFN